MSDNTQWMQSWLNLLAFMVTLLSYYAPWNGNTPVDVASNHPVPVRPVTYAYSIWVVMYLGLSLFLVWQLVPSNRDSPLSKAVGWWFIVASLFQAAWVPLWCFEQFWAAGAALLCIFLAVARLNAGLYDTPRYQRLPFTMWFGWTTLAVFIMLSTILIYPVNAKAFDSSPWAITLILTCALLASFWLRFTGEVGYPAAICWGIFGIYQADYTDEINVSSLSLFIMLLVLILITGLYKLLTEQKRRVARRQMELQNSISVQVDPHPPHTQPPIHFDSFTPPQYQVPTYASFQQNPPMYAYYYQHPQPPQAPQPPHSSLLPKE